jgi:hypothetical protein
VYLNQPVSTVLSPNTNTLSKVTAAARSAPENRISKAMLAAQVRMLLTVVPRLIASRSMTNASQLSSAPREYFSQTDFARQGIPVSN